MLIHTPQQKAPPPHQAGVLYHWGLSNAESGHDLILVILVTADVIIIKVLQPAITGCLYLCNIARNNIGRGRGRERERERDGRERPFRNH